MYTEYRSIYITKYLGVPPRLPVSDTLTIPLGFYLRISSGSAGDGEQFVNCKGKSGCEVRWPVSLVESASYMIVVCLKLN